MQAVCTGVATVQARQVRLRQGRPAACADPSWKHSFHFQALPLLSGIVCHLWSVCAICAVPS